MKKTNIHLIAAIFSLLSGIGILVLIITAIGTGITISKSADGAVHNGVGIGTGMIISILLSMVGGIGTFVSGIIQIVKHGESPVKGFALTAGILNVLGGVFFIGTGFSFYAHAKQD